MTKRSFSYRGRPSLTLLHVEDVIKKKMGGEKLTNEQKHVHGYWGRKLPPAPDHHDLVLSGDDECTGGACLLKAHKTASCTHWERYLHHNKQYEYLIDV